MENTRKQLTALNTDSIRHLVNIVNELNIKKEDVLKLFYQDGSYYLLYYVDCE
jgi:hypothetical protein